MTIECFYDKKTDIPEIMRKCWQRLYEIHVSMNPESDSGDIARVNRSGFYGVRVEDDVYGLLEDAVRYSDLTEGAFDVTVFPLVVLWKYAEKKGELPDKISLEMAREMADYRYILLDKDNMVFLGKDGVKIDLGAIAKGYAVDEVAGILSAGGVKHFLIDAGGDIYSRGKYNGEKTWKIGVQDPKKKDTIIGVLYVGNKAVTTSGDYERFFEIKGKRYSHIINPITGYPQKKIVSATVIASTAEEADAFSTALCVMGAKKGVDLINSVKDVEAMIVETAADGISKYKTNGYEKYESDPEKTD